MIIFLYGGDVYRSSRRLAEIKSKFLEKNKEGVALSVFDFLETDYDLEKIILDSSSGGLFSSKRLIVFKGLLTKKDLISEKFLDFLKRKSKGRFKNLVLVFWEGDDFDKKNPLAKLLFKVAKSQQFDLLDGTKLRSWINGEVEKISAGTVSINPKATEKLAIFVGNNLALLSKEIEKLVSYKWRGEILEGDVDLLVKSKIDTDIFKTIDSLARGDKKTAVKLLHDHLNVGDDPYYLLSMYFYQFRNLLKVKALSEKNISEEEITRKLKLHPFVVAKSFEQGKKFSLEKLKTLYKSLCQIDFVAKIGKIEIELALDKFIARV
ncbi:MAG: DNA polymerase III subunit delta [candidate division WOR-3 bacterium]